MYVYEVCCTRKEISPLLDILLFYNTKTVKPEHK